jgi:hypothetical protein
MLSALVLRMLMALPMARAQMHRTQVSFRVRFVQGSHTELVSREWSPRLALAATSRSRVGQRHELSFTVPEHRMSSAFPFHCVLEVGR